MITITLPTPVAVLTILALSLTVLHHGIAITIEMLSILTDWREARRLLPKKRPQ